jgi:hypothetical protein
MAVRLHQFHLPVWRATLGGAEALTYPSGDLGLVTVNAPAGDVQVAFRFGPTRDWVAGGLLALIGALAWSVLAWRCRRGTGGRMLAVGAIVLPVLVLALLLNAGGVGHRKWKPRQPVGGPAAVGDVAVLMGFDATPARGERALDITIYWLALRESATNYKTFVHLLDGGGQVAAQHDGDPGGGYTPTTRWMPGEVIADRHRLALPEGLPGDVYGVRAGMYALEDSGARNLPLEPATPDGRVDLGSQVVGPP